MSDSIESPLTVVAAVIRDGALILACRRNPGRESEGKWEFPGGKVDANESAETALVREIREELGAEIVDLSPLCVDDTLVDGRVIRLVCFTARFPGDHPTFSSDHDAMTWVHPDQLHTLDWAAPDLPAVRLLTLER